MIRLSFSVILLLTKDAIFMKENRMQKKPETNLSWEEVFVDTEHITKWRDSAFQAALEKLQETHGNTEVVMRTGEAFGRGLFAQQLQEKSPEWTMKQWLQATEEDVLKPLGTEFTFTDISHNAAKILMKRDPLHNRSTERSATSLFTYSTLRGLFLSAFPKGELLIKEQKTPDQQTSMELIFKTQASMKDKFERERVKQLFTQLQKR
jgi:hypothetical protein